MAAMRAVGRVTASGTAFSSGIGDRAETEAKTRQMQAEEDDVREVRETMATLAAFLQLLHRASSKSGSVSLYILEASRWSQGGGGGGGGGGA